MYRMAGYCRLSKEDGENRISESIENQMRLISEYVDKAGDMKLVRMYIDDGYSGLYFSNRPQFQQMMADIYKGEIQGVITKDISRLGREHIETGNYIERVFPSLGIRYVAILDGVDSLCHSNEELAQFKALLNDMYSRDISKKIRGTFQVQKKQGKYMSGFAPYGYRLVDGVLQINEDEAPAIRTIFEQYVNTDTGANGLSKYLETHGFQKLARQNGTSPLFSATLIRAILKNPVYCGKIAFGRRKLEKIHGTRNEYHQVPQENYLLVDGLHEGIVSEELWNAAQVKLLAQSKRYEPVNRSKTEQAHLLSTLVKCPVCGAGMYSNKCTKRKKDGTPYKSFSYYSCKHRKMQRGQKCDFNKQIQEEILDNAVVEVIIKLVSNPQFAAMMQEKINSKVDTTAIEQEIAAAEKQLRQYYSVKSKIMEEIDTLDPDDRHYIMRKSDLDERLYRMYDKIEEAENNLMEARAKKQAIEADKITGDNIYKVLTCFEKLYNVMDPLERKKLMEHLISEIQIYPERQPNGQWLKSIKFRLPIIENDMDLRLDNGSHVECVSCYTNV